MTNMGREQWQFTIPAPKEVTIHWLGKQQTIPCVGVRALLMGKEHIGPQTNLREKWRRRRRSPKEMTSESRRTLRQRTMETQMVSAHVKGKGHTSMYV